MIFKCPNCNGALKFDATTNKMICEYCMSYFSPEQIGANLDEEKVLNQEQIEHVEDDSITTDIGNTEDYMECNIYRCTSCGGELMVDGLESSTFCAYCGQPTIVFDRVSKEMRPKYIVPFSVSKTQAVEAIRERLNKGLFVPEEIKNFQMDRIRGIYIPYWLCDVDYEDRMSLRGTVGSGKNEQTRYYYRWAKTSFTNMTLDASYRLNDETSQRLEPFNTNELKEFNVSYMSGYYADRYDVEAQQIKTVAAERAKDLFEDEVIRTVKADNVKILKNMPTCSVKDTKYVLLPAWFLTFHYAGEPYTFLVNGQTRKVVGCVPYEKKYIVPLIVILSACFSAVAAFLMFVVLLSGEVDDDSIKIITMIVIGGFAAMGAGIKKFERLKQGVELTKSKVMMKFVKERQEE